VETLARIERAASATYAVFARQHADRPQLEALWQAFATAAQARADRLDVVRRLRGAGWHFADDDIPVERLERRWSAARAAAEAAPEGGPLLIEALDLALELEGREAREDFARATTPRDTTLRPSLEAASPPAPGREAIRSRILAALAVIDDPAAVARLDRLAAAWGGEVEARG
jgi:hypothetical protein